MCELLKTVLLLKSELIKEIISPPKLINTKNSCKKDNENILLSIIWLFLKFLIQKMKSKSFYLKRADHILLYGNHLKWVMMDME